MAKGNDLTWNLKVNDMATDSIKKLESELEKTKSKTKETTGMFGGLSSMLPSTGALLAGAGAAAGAFAVSMAVDGVKAAMEEDVALAQLQQTLDNVGQGFTMTGVEDFISKMQFATGVADDQLRPAFQALVTSTKDSTKAQKLLTLALDISVAKHKDLKSVSEALGKAATGNVGALTKLGVPLSDGAKKAGGFATAVDELSTAFGGAAATNAQTLTGKFQILQVSIDDVKESFGHGFIDALTSGQDGVDGLSKSVQGLSDVSNNAGQVVGNALNWIGNHYADAAATSKEYAKSTTEDTNAITRVWTGLVGFAKVNFTSGFLGTWGYITDLNKAKDAAAGVGEAAKAAAPELAYMTNEYTGGVDAIDRWTTATLAAGTAGEATGQKWKWAKTIWADATGGVKDMTAAEKESALMAIAAAKDHLNAAYAMNKTNLALGLITNVEYTVKLGQLNEANHSLAQSQWNVEHATDAAADSVDNSANAADNATTATHALTAAQQRLHDRAQRLGEVFQENIGKFNDLANSVKDNAMSFAGTLFGFDISGASDAANAATEAGKAVTDASQKVADAKQAEADAAKAVRDAGGGVDPESVKRRAAAEEKLADATAKRVQAEKDLATTQGEQKTANDDKAKKAVTAANIVADVKARVAKVGRWATMIKNLKDKGLPNQMLIELGSGSIDDGLLIGAELLKHPEVFKDLQNAYGRLTGYANTAGGIIATQVFGQDVATSRDAYQHAWNRADKKGAAEDLQPVNVNLVLDGNVILKSLVKIKRANGGVLPGITK